MKSKTASVGTHELDSSAVSTLGHFLRKYKIDELPQLINVIRGDMSLVGPRPCLVSQSALRAQRRKHNIFSIRPGVTGLAQVAGIDMSDPIHLTNYDAKYLSTMNLKLDIRIIFQTLSGSGKGDRLSIPHRSAVYSKITHTEKKEKRTPASQDS